MSPIETLILRALEKKPMTTLALSIELGYSQTGIATRLRLMQNKGVAVAVVGFLRTRGVPKNVWGLSTEPDKVYVRRTNAEQCALQRARKLGNG